MKEIVEIVFAPQGDLADIMASTERVSRNVDQIVNNTGTAANRPTFVDPHGPGRGSAPFTPLVRDLFNRGGRGARMSNARPSIFSKDTPVTSISRSGSDRPFTKDDVHREGLSRLSRGNELKDKFGFRRREISSNSNPNQVLTNSYEMKRSPQGRVPRYPNTAPKHELTRPLDRIDEELADEYQKAVWSAGGHW